MSHQGNRLRGIPRGVALLALLNTAAIGVALPSARGYAAEQPTEAVAAGERKVSLDFVGADVHTVAKALSIQSKVNVVVMPSINGKVTIRLTQTPLEEALKRVAAAVGSDVKKVDNTYFLGSTVELRAMMARAGVKEAVSLKYTPAAEVKALLQASLPYLTVESVEKSNIVVLAGSQEDVWAGAKIAKEGDIAPPAAKLPDPVKPVVLRDAYTAKFAKAAILATTLSKAMPELKVTHVEQTLVLEGTKEVQDQAAKILAALDVQGATEKVTRAYTLKHLQPHQASFTLKPFFPNMTIQAGFESYSPSKVNFSPLSIDAGEILNQQGLQGGGGAGGTSSGSSGGGGGAGGASGGTQDVTGPGFRSRHIILQGTAAEVEQATQVLISLDVAVQQVVIEARVVDMSPESSKQLGFTYEWSPLSFTENNGGKIATGAFGRTPIGFDVALEALEERREAKILARPNIAVIDGEEATIFIGDVFRYERLSSVTDSGQQVFTVEEIPIGVALLCRPRITDGQVTLRVHPVVSNIRTFTGRNNDIPVTASREAETIVRLKDGETFAIGGLLREEELKILTKIPILGDLPFIGNLFRHRNNSKKRSEVTIFITAKIRKD
jgi:general secretion pathway protein D